MKESKAINVTKHDTREDQPSRNYQLYTSQVTRRRYEVSKKEAGIQCNFKRDNLACTCRNISSLKRHQEVRYFSGLPRTLYAYHGSQSFTDIGVGSVKAYQRRKVRRVYLPNTDDRGVGCSDLSSVISGRSRYYKNSYYDHKKTSSKCVGGVIEGNAEYLNEKLSPIVQTKSITTSPSIPFVEVRNVEIGSNTHEKKFVTTSTEVEDGDLQKEERIKDIKVIEVTVEQVKEFSKYSAKEKKSKEVLAWSTEGRRRISKRAQEAERVFSSDSLVQHVHNLENPSEDKPSPMSIDPMENKLEREYRKIFCPQSKESKEQKSSEEKPDAAMKSTSILRRRFEALRRGLAKKEDSKKNAILAMNESSNFNAPSHRDVSITSDPPSLEARSYSNTKMYSPYPHPNQDKSDSKAIYKKSYTGRRDWSRPDEEDSESQGVKGMFKLWGKKFNLEDEGCIPGTSADVPKKSKDSKMPATESESKKEGKKFFFFKKKSKDQSKQPYKQKKGVTAGRCEVGDGLMIKIGAANTCQPEKKYEPKERKVIERIPEEYEEMLRKAWLQQFLAQTIESRHSVKIRWNNNAYATSSSTIFEMMENVYKDTGVVFRSRSETTTGESSYYKSFTKQRVNFVQDIEAWMIPKFIPDKLKHLPGKINRIVKGKNKDNIEVRISDNKWLIDKSKAFAQKIEVILHSKNVVKPNENPSSEYLRIDIPKGFFSDSNSESARQTDQTSNEEVYKIVEYESPELFLKNQNKGDHLPKDIKVTVSVRDSRDLESKILETVIKRPPICRDVVIQGSNVHIPERCNVIGVGIITQKDMTRIRKPILKIQDDYSDEDSDETVPHCAKKSKFAESYLQDYYRHWTPLGIDFFSWCVSDTHLQCCSENSQTTVNQQGDGSKSCPNIYDDYQTAMISSCGTSCCSKCTPWEDPKDKGKEEKEEKESKKSNFFGKFKSKNKSEPSNESEDRRILPKDSLEVCKKRKLYAASNKSKWFSSPDDKPYSVPSIDSRSAQDILGDSSQVRKPCYKPVQKKRVGNKHVSLPDCDSELPRDPTDLICPPPGILSFKGTSKCEVCNKSKGVPCAKHTKLIPEATMEIPPPRMPCKEPPPKVECPVSPSRIPPCPPSRPRSPPPPPRSPPRSPSPCPPSPPPCPPSPPPGPPSPPPCPSSKPPSPPPCPPSPPPCPPSPPPRPSSPPPCPPSPPPCPSSPPPSPPPCPPSPPPCPPSPPPCPSSQPTCPCSLTPSTLSSCGSPKRSDIHLVARVSPMSRPSPQSTRPEPCCSPSPPSPPCQQKPSPPSTQKPGKKKSGKQKQGNQTQPPMPPCQQKTPQCIPKMMTKISSCGPCSKKGSTHSPSKPPAAKPCSQKPSPPCSRTPPPPCSRTHSHPSSREGSPPSSREKKKKSGKQKQRNQTQPPMPPCQQKTPQCIPKMMTKISPCGLCSKKGSTYSPSQPPAAKPSPPCSRTPSPPCSRTRSPPSSREGSPPSSREGSPPSSREGSPPCSRKPSPPCPRKPSPPCSPKPSPLCSPLPSPPRSPPQRRKALCPPTPVCISPRQKKKEQSRSQRCPSPPPRNSPPRSPPIPCKKPSPNNLKCKSASPSSSCRNAPKTRSQSPPCSPPRTPPKKYHPCPPRPAPSPKPLKTKKCNTPPCKPPSPPRPPCDACKPCPSQEFPWPTKNQHSNQPSVSSISSDPPSPKGAKCKKDCSFHPPKCPKPKPCPRKPPCNSPPIVSGIFLKMAPLKKTCSKECSAWEVQDKCCSEDNIFINLKQGTASTEEIREGMHIKVQDENGRTLYERCDYQKHRSSVLNDMYQTNVHTVSTPIIQNMAVDETKSNIEQEVQDTKSEASVANLIEINFKLKVTQGDKATEINIGNDNVAPGRPELDTKILQTSQVFCLKDEAEQCIGTEEINDKNDINIKIIIKNYKPKKNNEKNQYSVDEDFNQKISNKFQTVSTGYSDTVEIHNMNNVENNENINEPDKVYSVHRATVDLTSSNEISKARESHEVISEDEYIRQKLKNEIISSRSATEKSGTEQSDSKLEDIGKNDSDCNNPRSYYKDKGSDKKARTYYSMTDVEDLEGVGDTNITSDEPTDDVNSTDLIPSSLTKEEKKRLLKKVFEKACKSRKMKGKDKMKQLRDIFKSSDHEDMAVTSNELIKEMTYASLKPNYFKNTDSMNNYYQSSVISSSKDVMQNLTYPTKNESECSVQNSDGMSSDENETSKPGCLCSTLAARLNICKMNEIGGVCCCKKSSSKKTDEETCCDLRTEEDFFLLNYKTIEYIDVETQNSKFVCNSTNLSVHSKAFSGSLKKSADVKKASKILENLNDVSKRKNIKRTFSPRSTHIRPCEMKKLNRNTMLGISDDDKVYLLNAKPKASISKKVTKKTKRDKSVEKVKNHKKKSKYDTPADILQCYETKKAVLEIYAERTVSNEEERLVAKLPKFVYNEESDIDRNYEEFPYRGLKRNVVMSVNR